MTAMPTSAGWSLAAGAVASITVGTLYDYPELVMLGLCAAVLVAMAVGWITTRGGIVPSRIVHPLRTAEGTPVTCVLTVSNRGRLPAREIEVVETVAGLDVRFVVDTLAGRSTEAGAEYTLPLARRGVYALPAPSVEMLDPVRLVRRCFATSGTTTVYIHPGFHPLPSSRSGSRHDEDGSALVPQAGGIAFYGLRDYVPGDDRRLIHWPSSARAGKLVVRHNSVPDAPGYRLVLDTTATGYSDASFEDAIRVAASLCVAAARSNTRLRLVTTGQTLTVASDDTGTQVMEMLDFLAGVSPTTEPVPWLSVLAGGSEDTTRIVVITGAATDPELTAIAQACSAEAELTVVRVDEHARAGRQMNPMHVLTTPDSTEFARSWTGAS
jgi:uncharacterized protein (DUF58 family)